jgi:hypothetical protein
MIRIRDTLTYETISTEDMEWLNRMSVSCTVPGINSWLRNMCNHQWTDDWIEIDIENSQKITYCVVCEINK